MRRPDVRNNLKTPADKRQRVYSAWRYFVGKEQKMWTVIPFLVLAANESDRVNYDRQLLLDAIRVVESGGDPRAVGDGGRSRGAYQVRPEAWNDARVPWPYSPFNERQSRVVAYRYMLLWAGEQASNETWARVWNGGPSGHKKKSTLPYWRKVFTAMRELERAERD
jgi:hypothetical protein